MVGGGGQKELTNKAQAPRGEGRRLRRAKGDRTGARIVNPWVVNKDRTGAEARGRRQRRGKLRCETGGNRK